MEPHATELIVDRMNHAIIWWPLVAGVFLGIFHFFIRKYLFPVSEKTINELEDQLPMQGLQFSPVFGLFLFLLGLGFFIYANWDVFFLL